jgi:hypothetical protein
MTVPIRPERPKSDIERALEILAKRNDDVPRPNEPSAGRRLAAAILGGTGILGMAEESEKASSAPSLPTMLEAYKRGQPEEIAALEAKDREAQQAVLGLALSLGVPGGPELSAAAQEARQIVRGVITKPPLNRGPGIEAWHGSPQDFDQFRLGASGSNPLGGSLRGRGVYLASDKDYAGRFRGRLTKTQVPFAELGAHDLDAYFAAQDALAAADGNRDLAVKRLLDAATYDRQTAAGPTSSLSQEEMSAYWMPKALAKERAAEYLKGGGGTVEPSSAKLYRVRVDARLSDLLNQDAPLSEQPAVLDRLRAAGFDFDPQMSGYEAYGELMRQRRGMQGASAALKKTGIPGMTYKDSGPKTGNTGTPNYVIFDPKRITILDKLLAMFTAGAAAKSAQEP